MSGLVGKGSRSYKKANVGDSNLPALGFRNIQFAFQNGPTALAANATITFASVIGDVPSEMAGRGFIQPELSEIVNAKFGEFKENLIVKSNLNYVLLEYVAYTINNDSITFIDGLNSDEIITITRSKEPITGNRIVDARPLRASGTVDFSTIGSAPVIFEVGEGFRIAPSTTATGGIDNRQIGFVQVFADGVLQARNVGNEDESMLPASEQTGNYREVIVDGLGNLLSVQNGVTANAIEFNQFQPFSAEEGVIVISTNLIVDSPNNTGVIDQLSTLQSQITQNDTELARIPTPVGGTPADIIQVNAGGTAYELVTPSSGGGGAIIAIQEFTASGTYNVPDDAVALRITASGAGGGGQGIGEVVSSSDGGTGGASGQYGTVIRTLAAGTSRTLAVGIGTAGTVAVNAAGGAGGDTTLIGTSITNTTWGGGPGGNGLGSGHRPNSSNPNDFSQQGGGACQRITVEFADVSIMFLGSVGGNIRNNALFTGLGGGNGGNNGKATGGNGADANGRFFGNNRTVGGGGGGGAGWTNGSAGDSVDTGTTGGAGGRGGMIIEALSILPT